MFIHYLEYYANYKLIDRESIVKYLRTIDIDIFLGIIEDIYYKAFS